MSGYTQLTQGQHYQMEALLKAGHNQTMIATILSIHKSTVSRELRRNQGLRGKSRLGKTVRWMRSTRSYLWMPCG